MNSDSADESGHEDELIAPSGINQTSVPEYTSTQSINHLYIPSQANSQDRILSYLEARWKRQSKHYNDQYLDLFIADQKADNAQAPLRTDQFGSVTWTDWEKTKFFDALACKGRHDLPKLAAAVGTKSVVEVRDYLERLKEADKEHQMFAQHAKNVSLADIDAAVEISEDLGERLEEAADALATFQDKYDIAKARSNRVLWFIDIATAQSIDKRNQEREAEMDENPSTNTESSSEIDGALQMFHFETLLELSRSTFMNHGAESEHGDWTEYAEEDEQPSLTVEATEMLYSLVKSLVQRVLQVSLFLAQSRIRSTTTPEYTPSHILKDTDVTAALEVLKMPQDSWDFWTSFPRRSGLSVILGKHQKGQNEPLTLAQIEKTLSVRGSRGRHRSLSAIVSQSSQEPSSDLEREVEGSSIQEGSDGHGGHESPLSILGDEDIVESNADQTADDDEDDGPPDGEDDRSYHDSSTQEQRVRMSRKRRRILMEESQEEYVKKLDHAAQLREEHRLQHVLGSSVIKEETEEELPRRPRVERKTIRDLKDWAEVTYLSPWERKRPLPEDLDHSAKETENL